ncbi:alpha-ketoglutarate-dependent dioxygenase alkB homolog 7, mitochondrial-like [Cyprinus carpio]|uniref:Alpha-ketoglutarate-dependent dioxygenase alkB homolog 7, mitochondrial-like n=1 Tax=Cyprinus carpio TaxID=7962 RepID=A0A8C1I3M7_CYPCA|nr:alpha-ketoglutarate-dependent dioxygenase alkB homolog 7, mitochondrial-like [Cyprinus carpio]
MMALLIRVSKQVQRKSFQNPLLYRLSSECSASRKGPESKEECKWMFGSSQDILAVVRGHVEVRQNFISEEEENELFKEVETGLRKKRYEFDHWDDAIHGYRETERLQWGVTCESILRRVRAVAFPEDSPLLGPVHVLDLDKDGYIKPHIDSVKFCGSTIAGLSLLSDSVMRLTPENKSTDWVDLLLSRRSLYILRDDARFKFTHGILKDEESFFSGQKVPRHRRISVICRNLPV